MTKIAPPEGKQSSSGHPSGGRILNKQTVNLGAFCLVHGFVGVGSNLTLYETHLAGGAHARGRGPEHGAVGADHRVARHVARRVVVRAATRMVCIIQQVNTRDGKAGAEWNGDKFKTTTLTAWSPQISPREHWNVYLFKLLFAQLCF